MQKPISPKTHGVLDYTTSAAVAMAPMAIDLPKRASAVAYGLAGGYTALSMLTKYPMGAAKVVPFKGHGLAEAAIGLALPFVPRMLHIKKKSARKKAQLFFCGIATLTAIVAAMTDWNSTAARGQIGGNISPRAAAA
jgi:hypothetical protein